MANYKKNQILSRAKDYGNEKCWGQIQFVILLNGDNIVYIGHTEKLESLFDSFTNELGFDFDKVFNIKVESVEVAKSLVYDYKIKFGLPVEGDVKSLVTENKAAEKEIIPEEPKSDNVNTFSAETMGLEMPQMINVSRETYNTNSKVKKPYVWTAEELIKSGEIVQRALANTARLNQLRAKGLYPA